MYEYIFCIVRNLLEKRFFLLLTCEAVRMIFRVIHTFMQSTMEFQTAISICKSPHWNSDDLHLSSHRPEPAAPIARGASTWCATHGSSAWDSEEGRCERRSRQEFWGVGGDSWWGGEGVEGAADSEDEEEGVERKVPPVGPSQCSSWGGNFWRHVDGRRLGLDLHPKYILFFSSDVGVAARWSNYLIDLLTVHLLLLPLSHFSRLQLKCYEIWNPMCFSCFSSNKIPAQTHTHVLSPASFSPAWVETHTLLFRDVRVVSCLSRSSSILIFL